MDIEINEVQEIIKNLDSGGEISIKEEKYLKVAKLCVQLAAERDAALNAERAWEKTMMEVCGEDGHASVAAVINALAAENVALKAGASYFSYGSEHGFEWHKTESEAIEAAESAIDDYRGDACDGWNEEVDSICWGIIMQSSTMVGERPRTEEDRCDSAIDTICDYALLPAIETPATDRIVAGIKADGVEEFVSNTVHKIFDESGAVPALAYLSLANSHVKQLREGANK